MQDELVIVAAPDHALAARSIVTAKQLAAAPWILREHGSGTRQATDAWLIQNLEQVQVGFELGSTEAIKRVVASGTGLACLSRYTVAQALEDVGGALAVYQRSYEGNALAQAAVSADLCFAFSASAARTEADAGSAIDYCVVTGYLGDHRFAGARARAAPVRAALRAAGAEYIAAYFDENSGDDGRWMLGHERERRHYAFLLEKLLAEPRFGLVLKPKSPRTLRRRLGPVAPLLERALATGRCHLYEDGLLQGSTTPAQAAFSADLAIHSSVAAATAGMEAALAGAPVVLIDDDGWSISPLQRLGRGRVIFEDWEALWHTWSRHREAPASTGGFADWTPMLDDLDPFRDGRAAERMGAYLHWLIEGYEAGRAKADVLAGAAARYAEAWGRDKVFRVGGRA